MIQNLQNDTVIKFFVRQVTTVQYKWIQYCVFPFFNSSIFGTWPQDAIEVKCGTDVSDHLLEMCRKPRECITTILFSQSHHSSACEDYCVLWCFQTSRCRQVKIKQNGSIEELSVNPTKTQWGLVDACYQCQCFVLLVVCDCVS